jgi:curved DNA-binding protein
MAVATKDYYQLLGVPKTATEDEIRKEYRNLARKHHPDLNPGDKSAENRFKEINEAYEVLSDSEKRRRYDQPAPNPRAGFHDGGEAFSENGADGFGDLFADLFRARRATPGGAPFRTKGRDVNATIALTVEEAHTGVVRSIQFEAAGGQPKSLEVTIPPGVRDDSVIRLAGQGEPGAPGSPAGDLYLHVDLEPHHFFQLLGDDIQVELSVTPWEALLGAKVNVPTLDGKVEMTIPPASQSGQRLRLRQQGLKKRAGGRGDEYVKLKVVVPTSPTPREKELFEKLAAESHFNPREPSTGAK